MTSPDDLPVTPPPAGGSVGPRSEPLVGPRAVLEVCGRAALILLVLAVLLYLVLLGTEVATPGSPVDAGTAAWIVALMYGIHLAALALLGWPAGAVVAQLVRDRPSELQHVGAFALAGGVLGAVALLVPGQPGAAVVWGVLGAVVAGAARAWTGAARRRRAARRTTA